MCIFLSLCVYVHVCSTCYQTNLTLLRATLTYPQHTVPLASAFAGTEVKACFAMNKNRAFGSDTDMWPLDPSSLCFPPGISAVLLHHDYVLGNKSMSQIGRLSLPLINVLHCYKVWKRQYTKWIECPNAKHSSRTIVRQHLYYAVRPREPRNCQTGNIEKTSVSSIGTSSVHENLKWNERKIYRIAIQRKKY